MPHYTAITIVFNPNSTGSSKRLAEELKDELVRELPGTPVTLMPTQHPGHAEEIAYDAAKASARPLIISSSGDGGYHEVVNGLMRAQSEGAKPVSGLLPGGNANDHYRSHHELEMVDAIKHGKTKHIDILELDFMAGGKTTIKYAHSYIGVGLTPSVAKQLNKTSISVIKEMWIVGRAMLKVKPVVIIKDHKAKAYTNLTISAVNRIAKYFSIAAPHGDGQLSVVTFTTHHKLRLFSIILKGYRRGFKAKERGSHYGFITAKETLMQLDGELEDIPAHTRVMVRVLPKALTSII